MRNICEDWDKAINKRLTWQLKNALGIKRFTTQTQKNYIANSVKHFRKLKIRNQDQVEEIVKEWERYDIQSKMDLTAKEIPMVFYYYLIQRRLNETDRLVYDTYIAAAEEILHMEVNPRPDTFRGRGTDLIERLEHWLHNAGNDIEDVLIDYFEAVIRAMHEWKPSTIHNPKTAFSDWAWSEWIDWVDLKFECKEVYLEPSEKELEEEHETNEAVERIHEIRSYLFRKGRIDLYDDVGDLGGDLDAIENLLRNNDIELANVIGQ